MAPLLTALRTYGSFVDRGAASAALIFMGGLHFFPDTLPPTGGVLPISRELGKFRFVTV